MGRMEEPMGRREGIVVSASPNISGNSVAMSAHFGPPSAGQHAYSGRMESLPATAMPMPTTLAARAMRWLCALAFAAVPMAHAAEPPGSLDAALDQQVQQLARQSMRPGSAVVSRVEVVVGKLDPRLRLAPCQQVEPYLPNGVRLWGKSRIGLRCTRGQTAWNVFLPITVKAWGRALVATAVLPAGSVLAAGDLAQAEVDLAEDNAMALDDTRLAVGRTLARALLPGQSLRVAHLKPRQWFSAGDTVQVLARGDGFAAASVGEALNPGFEGQVVRVRMDGGRVLVGTPVAENRVELPL